MTDTPACTCAHLDTDWHQPSCPITADALRQELGTGTVTKPACVCDHDGLPADYHLDGCPASGRPLPTPEQAAVIDALAQDMGAALERTRAAYAEATAGLPDLPLEPTPDRSTPMPPGATECPPGVHSMFDPCPGNCTVPVVQLRNGGLAQDEDGLSLQAWDDQRRDYEVRLTPAEAVELAAMLTDATSAQPIGPVIAARIRAELVCCTIADTGDPERAREAGHDICYWGEMAARLAEGTDQP